MSKAAAPFLLAEQDPALKPAEEGWLRGQTVAVTSRLQQLDLGDHLKLLWEDKKGTVPNIRSSQLITGPPLGRDYVGGKRQLTLRRFSKLIRPPCGDNKEQPVSATDKQQ